MGLCRAVLARAARVPCACAGIDPLMFVGDSGVLKLAWQLRVAHGRRCCAAWPLGAFGAFGIKISLDGSLAHHRKYDCLDELGFVDLPAAVAIDLSSARLPT